MQQINTIELMMKNKYIPVRKLTQITEERFNYLMNTLPWNLSKEDQAEATQLKKAVQPLLDIEMLKLWERCEGTGKSNTYRKTP